MAIRWDSVLVRELARELDREFGGARLRAIRLDARTREAVLFFRDRTMVWRLHPERSGVWCHGPITPQAEDLRLPATVRGIRTLPDERILTVELQSRRSARGPWTLIVELLGNRMNAIVTEGSDHTVRHVLRTRSGSDAARIGKPWILPNSAGRRWVDGHVSEEEWQARLLPVPPPDRRRELLSTTAWVSTLNAEACLADHPDRPFSLGLETWRRLAAPAPTDPPSPVILETEHGLQPYPVPLPGTRSQPVSTLIGAIAACSDADDARPAGALAVGPELLERLEDAIAAAERRVVRLTAQLDGRQDPSHLRRIGDLILARFREIPGGASSITLKDFDGSEVELQLDPELATHQNASRYYDRASRSERAAERIPRLIEDATRDVDRLRTLLASAHAGAADAETVREAVPPSPSRQSRRPRMESTPYRCFRTSGGLEVRVGRGSRQNDDLTFRNSSPNDIWLHARQATGAHVILRWRGAGSPPARDLEEAACLAALHSRARTSQTVPVDWTLRKYVRKPRGSAPGAVVPDRVQTLFVTPDQALLDQLSSEESTGA